MSRLAPPSSIALSPAEEDTDVEVTKEDQLRINEFGRLNSRKYELRDEIAAAKARNEELADAEEGVLLADESEAGVLKLQIGDCFFDVDASAATEYIESRRARNLATIEANDAALQGIEVRQKVLKELLYGKFGRSINLEDKE